MSLQNLQAELAEIILSNDHTTDLVQPISHLRIYQNNIISSLVKTLKEIYPLINKLLGDDFFLITIKEYIKRYPAISSNLHDYGEYIGDFLAEYEPVKNLIYLAEVAQFEWACHGIYFATDHIGFDPVQLEKISPNDYEKLHFILHPASQIIKFHYPILRIIDLCKGEVDGTIDINEGGINLLIIRRHLDISLVPLTTSEYIFLTALHDNKSLAEALELTHQIDADFKLEEKLSEWIRDKTIVECF